MTILIHGGNIVNENRAFQGSVIIKNNLIAEIIEGNATPHSHYDNIIDATGCFVLPGVIDEHVHCREPGLTSKADLQSESKAAAFGGVTSMMDMPNTSPQTTSIESWQQKMVLGQQHCSINYAFFFGASNNNIEQFAHIDTYLIPGIKLFMGASTGNMLVDKRNTLEEIFKNAPIPVMTHCEDSNIIHKNMQKAKVNCDDPNIMLHPKIRSEEACYQSTKLAIALATQYNTKLHVAHLTTAKELELFGNNPNITAEVAVPHLLFNEKDYLSLGSLIKCNPAIKTLADQTALLNALTTDKIYTIATDHAPHLPQDKVGGSAKAASGMPMLQFSLPAMLDLVDKNVMPIERLVTLMCHHPATLFAISRRGFLRKNYYADIAIVKPNNPWTVTKECIQSKCKWSPVEGRTFHWQVKYTICNGKILYNNGQFNEDYRGKALRFRE